MHHQLQYYHDILPRPRLIQDFIDDINAKYHLNIEIKLKTKPDWKLKIVGKIVRIFNKSFDRSYVTTIGNTIWVPENFFKYRTPVTALNTIAHEVVHIVDRKNMTTVPFVFLYLFPQILTPLALLSLLGGPWLFCLLFLLCICPWPAPGRMWLELRAYRMNLLYHDYVNICDEKQIEKEIEWVAEQFTESNYYYMWPFINHILSLLWKYQKDEEKEVYAVILEWLNNRGLILDKEKINSLPKDVDVML